MIKDTHYCRQCHAHIKTGDLFCSETCKELYSMIRHGRFDNKSCVCGTCGKSTPPRWMMVDVDAENIWCVCGREPKRILVSVEDREKKVGEFLVHESYIKLMRIV